MNVQADFLISQLTAKLESLCSGIAALQQEAAEIKGLLGLLAEQAKKAEPVEEKAQTAFAAPVVEEQKPEAELVAPVVPVEISLSAQTVVATVEPVAAKPVLVEPVAANPVEIEAVTADPKPKTDARLVSDLRKAIGLNDRFRFRHDLFGNDDKLMMESIDAINALHSFDEAMAYIREHFSWSEDDDTVHYFLDLLHRRFYSDIV